MISLLANSISAFTPLALITGLSMALWSARNAGKAPRAFLMSIGVGLTAAVPVYLLSARSQTVTAARVFLYSAAIIGALIHAGTLFLPENRGKVSRVTQWGAAVAFLAALALAAMFSFLDLMGERGLSAVTAMNTELILNVGAIGIGACSIALLIPLTAHVAPKSGKRVISGCLLAASALIIMPWLAEILLGLMRLEAIPVGGGGLSFVAKVKKFAIAAPYIQLAMAAGLSSIFLFRRTVFTADELAAMPSAQRRKVRTGIRFDALWFRASAAFLCAALAVLLSYDLYASRPPQITRPLKLTPDGSGSIRIKTADVAGGDLHRYSYVTDDGHVVRFLIIELSSRSGRSKFGVVHDACVMCGDKGYIQRKREVVCLACNVRIFNPSIGKEGGCNPIPLRHSVEGGYILISAEELDKGAQHFSEVVSIRVKDPVTGSELDSLKASSRYEYKGRNYFFEADESRELFMASPEKYSRKSFL